MRALVVHAHPDPDSFSHALVGAALAGLAAGGHTADLVDLYAEGFDPRLGPEERRAYETASPILHEQVRRYAELVRQAEAVILVYPTWWFGLPAVLKGFLDRVLAPGVAFRLDPVTHRVRPGLTSVRHLVGIATYGSPRSYVRLLGDPGRRTVTRTLRLSCGRRCRTSWLGLYGIEGTTEAERDAFLAHVRERLVLPRTGRFGGRTAATDPASTR